MNIASYDNTRPRAVEVIVDGESMHVIADRETVAALIAREHLLP